MCAGNECGNHFYCDAVPTRKGSLGGSNDASSIAWATHGSSFAACIAGPAALLRRFSFAAWRGLACARVAPPDQIPVSIVGWACFYVSRVYCFLHRCCSSELHPGASQYFRAWSPYFLRLHLAHGGECRPDPFFGAVWLVSRSSLFCEINLRAFWSEKIWVQAVSSAG